MKETVLQRVINICSAKFASESQFAKAIGINQKTINQQFRRERSISIDTILAVLSSFEDISAEWLLRGTGDMELSSTSEELEDASLSDNYILNVMANALDDLHKFLEIKENKINELEKELESYRKKQVG